ncbi:MAG: imidazole glycerol phosphate synthase subunit HisH [Bacteroidetes bacterium]|nr:imidazole glycerol phosphate synthase subunit HisH [Bacteroidota bacterium]
MMKKAVIVDYQLGNLFSVNQALINIGLDAKVSLDPADINRADALILPGVGAFKDAMENLTNLGLKEPIRQFISSGKPFLGICLGLQLLFTESEEFGASEGLGVISGKVKRFSNRTHSDELQKVPQISWNTINKASTDGWQNTPLMHLEDEEDMYFVHSFYVVPVDQKIVLSKTTYGDLTYASSILQGNIFACQFHPEKSAEEGLKIYRTWAELNQLIY